MRFVMLLTLCVSAFGEPIVLNASPGDDLGALRDRARAERAARPEAAIEIVLGPGVYRVTEPLTFTPADSGSAGAPLTIRSAAGGRATISGGIAVTGWTVREDGIWAVDWYGLAGREAPLSALFVDGKFRGPCRTPNEDFFYTAGKAPATKDADGNDVDNTKLGFLYNEGEIANWPDRDQAVILSYHSWDVSHNRIASLDEGAKLVTFRQPVTWAFEHWGPKQRYVVQHVRSALDAPGEWYLDRTSGELLYVPMAGETPETTTVVAPVAEVLVSFEGDPAAGDFVEHIRFEDVTFAHTNFAVPDNGIKDDQAAYPTNAAIMGVGAHHVTLERCTITQTSNYGVWFGTGCRYNRVGNSRLHHLGAGGVRFGHMSEGATEHERASHNTVENCFIYDGGYHLPEAVGVWIGRSSYNRVAHNSIHDFYYTGVSLGWSWGYDPSTANHNLVEYNHIFNLGKGVLSDMGGVYHLGVAPGTIVRNNLIHDVKGYYYGAWGLYTDEGSSDVLMENNVVYDVQTGGFHQHYGRDNRIFNNILAFSEKGQVIRSRAEDHNSFFFERNIVYYETEELLGSNWDNGNYRMASNCYWNSAGLPVTFKGANLAEWQAQGHDLGSIVADPNFVDPANRDFRLMPGSPALALGFTPIDLSTVGPLGYTGPGAE